MVAFLACYLSVTFREEVRILIIESRRVSQFLFVWGIQISKMAHKVWFTGMGHMGYLQNGSRNSLSDT